MTTAYDRQSSYQPHTLGEEARRVLACLLTDLDAGEVDEDTHYGMDCYTAEEYTLGGGGPGHDVTFVIGSAGDIRAAFFSYFEMTGTVAIALTDHQAQRLRKALRNPSNQEQE